MKTQRMKMLVNQIREIKLGGKYKVRITDEGTKNIDEAPLMEGVVVQIYGCTINDAGYVFLDVDVSLMGIEEDEMEGVMVS